MEWKYKKYQGWSNYFTWNISLLISNDYHLYKAACVFARDFPGDKNKLYISFIEFMGLQKFKTRDGVECLDKNINLTEMNNYMLELIS